MCHLVKEKNVWSFDASVSIFLSFSLLPRDGTNTLGIITFALLFGTVLGTLGERAKPVIAGFRVIDDVIMSIVRGVMWYVMNLNFAF